MPRASTTVYLETYGCQMNALDSELVTGLLARAGYQLTPRADEAGVLLVNTCSVRGKAEAKVHTRLGQWRRLKERAPELVIGVLGCMAQKEQAAFFDRYPHVDLVVGTGEFPRLAELLARRREEAAPVLAVGLKEPLAVERDVTARPTPFQAFVSVMRGCDQVCSFCVVPRTRGPEVSRPAAEIEDEVRRLLDDGVVEITLLGQTVNAWGRKLDPPVPFAALLARLAALPGLQRLRFVTSHPRFVDAALIAAFRDLPPVCEYLHFPMQSGSDRVLARMRRGYTRGEYLDLVARLRATRPDLAPASDWIVGYPGETDEDFEDTVSALRAVGCQQSFIFRYSPRERTTARREEDDVPAAVKAARNTRLLAVQEEISRAQQRALIGTEQEVLVEGPSKHDPTKWTGRTRQNRIVAFAAGAPQGGVPRLASNAGDDPLLPPRVCRETWEPALPARAGRLARVRIEDCTPLTLFGTLV